MAQKNNVGNFFMHLVNSQRVSRHRKISLVKNYRLGLAHEFKRNLDSYIEKETKRFEGYYQEDVKAFQDQLNGLSTVDNKREKHLEKFAKKQYWARRKYKTKQQRHVDDATLKDLMVAFDKQQKEDKKHYENKLQRDLPHQALSDSKKRVLVSKIKHFEDVKNKRLQAIQAKYEKRAKNFTKFERKNNQYIANLDAKYERLSAAINAFNSNRIAEENAELEKLSKSLQKTQDNQNLSEQKKHKKIAQIQNKIDMIETTVDMLKNDHIHLSVSHLKMYFGGVKAVNDLSFKVNKGEIFGLIGPNGAGKTTVFNCLTQFYRATGGQMVFKNKEGHIIHLKDYKTHDMINEGISRSFQNVELIWELTVLDNLLVAAHSLVITNLFDHMFHTRKLIREETVLRTKGYQILKDLGIEEFAFRSPYGLPYGILKKVELARTMMTNPSLIILDEPAAGLNDGETMELAKVINKINQMYGITIFLVEHDMSLVMSICNRVCAISFGKLIGLGTPQDIQNNPEVRKAYLGDDDDE